MIASVWTVGILLQLLDLTHGMPQPAATDSDTAPNYYVNMNVTTPDDTAQDPSSASGPYYFSLAPPPAPIEVASQMKRVFRLLRRGCAFGLSPCGSGCCHDVMNDNACPPGTQEVDGGCLNLN
ncbi:uncharacterized protein LOC119104002 [Pollicipes pollicipes]|uniref:uncharacterized protein LOC119104002 n=1 Tax=Pollicipes pollicipes TaxID=41117 RepID=UPI0018858F19|nr:uncharacterized protein LOC119104002 [Pollicipes pollicipes]